MSFPIRNRLISGLTLGTVIVEASVKSGSLITADHALNQGKDVFAVPGNIMSSAYAGSNRLLRDGAKPVFSAADILSEYTYQYPHKINMDTAYTIIGEDSFKTSAADAVEGQETDSINGDKDTYSQSTDNYASYRKRSNMSAFISDDLQKKVKSINGESNNRRNPEYIKNEMSQIEGLSESSVKVFEYLKDGPAVVDNIIDKTGLSAAEVLAAVTELEIRGAIEVLAGNICRIK